MMPRALTYVGDEDVETPGVRQLTTTIQEIL
jgi:hypothetical protein